MDRYNYFGSRIMYVPILVVLFRTVAEMIVIVIPEGAAITVGVPGVAGVTINVESQRQHQ